MHTLHVTTLLGCFLTMLGIGGGATHTLSGDVPLYLAALGCAFIYLSIILMGIASLWHMDEGK
jgi:hypothetical protein